MNDAIDEIITIGREAKIPVQISHIKIALKDDWKTAPKLIAALQKARTQGIDITADCYPYNFWNSTLRVLFPKKILTAWNLLLMLLNIYSTPKALYWFVLPRTVIIKARPLPPLQK